MADPPQKRANGVEVGRERVRGWFEKGSYLSTPWTTEFFSVCPSLTPGEEDGVEFEAASILQPSGQLTEVTAVQVQGDPQGLSAALHLVTHWCVCKT